MLNNIVVVVISVLILILFIGIIRKKKPESSYETQLGVSVNEETVENKFSKILESLRKLLREIYSGMILVAIIFLIFFSTFTFVLWQSGYAAMTGYLMLEIIKKIILKNQKSFDTRFYIGISLILITAIYIFTADKNTLYWSEILNATAGGTISGGFIFLGIILILYILEKIYLSFFNRKKEYPSNKKNNNYSKTNYSNLENSSNLNIKTEPLVNEDEKDNEIYEKIAQELEENIIQKGLWTKATAEADGDKNKTESIYIKFRFNQIKEEQRKERERKENFERIKYSK